MRQKKIQRLNSFNLGFQAYSKIETLHTVIVLVTWTRFTLTQDFPFDQKFRKSWVWKQMEQTFSGISFRNFGRTLRGWPKIPENSVLFDHSCSGLVSPRLEIELNMADLQASNYRISDLSDKRLKYFTSTLLQWIGHNRL